MKLQFTLEDFYEVMTNSIIEKHVSANELSRLANARLAEMLKEHGKVVYGNEESGYIADKQEVLDCWDNTGPYYESIVFHQKLMSETCEHEPSIKGVYDYKIDAVCKHCGVKLKANWEPVDE